MLTGQARNDIDKLWEKFWTGGITNPLTVIEQISYLMFARMLDMQEEQAERKAARSGKAFEHIFPETSEGQLLRWKNFKNIAGKELHKHLKDEVYPFFAKLGEQPNEDLSAEGKVLEGLINIGEYMQAVIVPDGVLFGSSNAHQQLRQALLEQNQLEGIVSLPSGVFKPYAGVSTAILIFTKGGQTERVWFYDVQADGFSLDDKRTKIEANDLPDVLAQWQQYRALVLSNAEAAAIEQAFGDKTQAAFVVSAAAIAANKFDLSINRYKEVVYAQEEYEAPKVILGKLKALEEDILRDLVELEGML